MGHTIGLISTLKTLGITLWGHNVCQPTIFSIMCPCCRLQYFYWIEKNVNFKGFQRKSRRWIYYKCLARVTRLHIIFMCNGVYCTLLYYGSTHSKSRYTSAHTIYHTQCTYNTFDLVWPILG